MLTIKQSIVEVTKQIQSLLGVETTDLRLEEINKENKNAYNLTVSFLIPNKNLPDNISAITGVTIFPFIRQYKQLKVNKNDGNIITMKMYNNA